MDKHTDEVNRDQCDVASAPDQQGDGGPRCTSEQAEAGVRTEEWWLGRLAAGALSLSWGQAGAAHLLRSHDALFGDWLQFTRTIWPANKLFFLLAIRTLDGKCIWLKPTGCSVEHMKLVSQVSIPNLLPPLLSDVPATGYSFWLNTLADGRESLLAGAVCLSGERSLGRFELHPDGEHDKRLGQWIHFDQETEEHRLWFALPLMHLFEVTLLN